MNGPAASGAASWTTDDVNVADWEAHRLPDEARTPEQIAVLQATAKKGLTALAKWQPTKQREVPKKLVRLAEEWLDNDLVRSSHAAYNFTPMDGVLSLSKEGRLQVMPRFRSPDAQYALTFAELVAPRSRRKKEKSSIPIVRRCWCGDFYVANKRGQPRKLCDRHYEQSKQTRKKTK